VEVAVGVGVGESEDGGVGDVGDDARVGVPGIGRVDSGVPEAGAGVVDSLPVGEPDGAGGVSAEATRVAISAGDSVPPEAATPVDSAKIVP